MSTDQLSIPIGVRLQLSDRFVQLLAREIASSTYAAGDLLPGEAMLALRYGVSKPTIRQGLKTLASLGLIRIQHGKRSVVLDQSNWNVFDPVIHQALSVAVMGREL